MMSGTGTGGVPRLRELRVSRMIQRLAADSAVCRKRRWVFVRAAAVLVLGWGAWALSASIARAQTADGAAPKQPATRPTAQTHPQNPELWDAEQMMEDAILQISRRYNLNKAQENYTRRLLISRTRKFLRDYEPDIRELLKESIDFRLDPRKATPDALKRWAERGAPIYEAAVQAILDGNEEWRDILNPDQRQLHDQDLAQMNANFAQIGRVMDQWKAGKGLAGLAMASAQPEQPTEQGHGLTQQPETAVSKFLEDNWLAYVNKFIQAYQLDEKQANAARMKVHSESFEQAKAYRERHKAAFDTIESELRSPRRGADRPIQPKELFRRRVELEKPIREMFVAMDGRLKELLRSDQRSAVDPDAKKQLDNWYKTLSGEFEEKFMQGGGVTSRPDAPATDSQPTSRPASPEKSSQGRPPPPVATTQTSQPSDEARATESVEPTGDSATPTAPTTPAIPAANTPAQDSAAGAAPIPASSTSAPASP